MNDKRLFQRQAHFGDKTVLHCAKDGCIKCFPVLSENVSASGIQFKAHESFGVGDTILVNLDHTLPIEPVHSTWRNGSLCLARVVWTTPLQNNFGAVGAHFISKNQIDESDVELMTELVNAYEIYANTSP